jgi:UTP--glucose-1-phosphate uridylyltransferase
MACTGRPTGLAERKLADELAGLDPALAARLAASGFDPGRLLRWAERIDAGAGQNRVTGTVEPPAAEDVAAPPAVGSAAAELLAGDGRQLLATGGLALVVLAGGMATRMGGVVKALVEALDGRTFLDLRLAERAHWSNVTGAPLPLWVMTSAATDPGIREAVAAHPQGAGVEVFEQDASLRLTPQGGLFLDAAGAPSIYATGHGDLPDALARSGLLERFLAGGGRYLWIANLDNLGAGVDPLLLGWHAAHGHPLTVEVVAKEGDTGGIPVRWDGRPVVLEEFRLPEEFDASRVPVFNTNTLLVDAAALHALDMPWTYFTVRKEVDGRPAIQFERLIGELTSGLETRFLMVPRSGPGSRFLPVKEPGELELRRPEIAARMAAILD